MKLRVESLSNRLDNIEKKLHNLQVHQEKISERLEALVANSNDDTTATMSSAHSGEHSPPPVRVQQRKDPATESPIPFHPPVTHLPQVAEQAPYYDLVVGINTVPRIQSDGYHLDYLNKTVFSLKLQMERFTRRHPDKRILLLIQSNKRPNLQPHEVFHKLQRALRGHAHIIMLDNTRPFIDPFTDIPGHDYFGFWNTKPGSLARQQNCDVGK
jgi:hypothetical protein